MTKQSKNPAVYITTNKCNGVLYTGVTSNLIQRIYSHKHKIFKGFSSKYNCTKLVFFEIHQTMENAILKEKQIKAGSRKKKINLIEKQNPDWIDLYDELVQ